MPNTTVADASPHPLPLANARTRRTGPEHTGEHAHTPCSMCGNVAHGKGNGGGNAKRCPHIRKPGVATLTKRMRYVKRNDERQKNACGPPDARANREQTMRVSVRQLRPNMEACKLMFKTMHKHSTRPCEILSGGTKTPDDLTNRRNPGPTIGPRRGNIRTRLAAVWAPVLNPNTALSPPCVLDWSNALVSSVGGGCRVLFARAGIAYRACGVEWELLNVDAGDPLFPSVSLG